MVMIGQRRAEKKRVSAELKDMNTKLYALEGFVAIQAREFINYKARFGHLALTLLVIGVSGFVAQFLIMIYQQSWAT